MRSEYFLHLCAQLNMCRTSRTLSCWFALCTRSSSDVFSLAPAGCALSMQEESRCCCKHVSSLFLVCCYHWESPAQCTPLCFQSGKLPLIFHF